MVPTAGTLLSSSIAPLATSIETGPVANSTSHVENDVPLPPLGGSCAHGADLVAKLVEQALTAPLLSAVPTGAPTASEPPALAVVLPGASVRRVWHTLFATPVVWECVHTRLGYKQFAATRWAAPRGCGACLERVVTFVVPLTQAVGPSTTRMTSTQTARRTAGGRRLVIAVVTQCHDAPYAESFVVQAAIVVDEQGSDCALRIRWAVKFIKSVWMVRSLIESTALRDNHLFYRALALTALAALAIAPLAAAPAPARLAPSTPAATDVALLARSPATAPLPPVAAPPTPLSSPAAPPLPPLPPLPLSRDELDVNRRPDAASSDVELATDLDLHSLFRHETPKTTATWVELCVLFAHRWMHVAVGVLALVLASCAVAIAFGARSTAIDAHAMADANRAMLMRFDARLAAYGEVLQDALRTPTGGNLAPLVARLDDLRALHGDAAWRLHTPPTTARQRAELEAAAALINARLAVQAAATVENCANDAVDNDAAVTAETALRESARALHTTATYIPNLLFVSASLVSTLLAIAITRVVMS